ncbi:major facilitator superfamily transporter [Ceratobasidium sp. AG-Ba]|nr:major facilitator superfamily transporter [Ceratobasidium sp. AG-Ba]
MGNDTLETKPFLESRENDALGKEDPGALAGSSSENLGNEHLDDADGPQSRPETKSKSFSRRKASPWWLLPIVTITALLYAATIAPRTELLVKLACNELHPDWDLASNATTGQHNTTADSSSRITRRLPVLLQFVHRSASNKRSNIDIPGTNIMCSDDVDVQKAVAKLNTAISTTSGILSVLTTAIRQSRARSYFDYRRSFRHDGRCYFCTSNGLFGGFSTAIATSHAYVSDCVPSTERSRWFSLWSGIIFGGMAFGPSLGSLVSDYTKNIMVIFYIMVVFDLIYTIFVGFVLPESMSEESLRRASESKKSARQGTGSVWWKEMIGKLLKVIAPLAMFFPRVVSRSGTRKRYDWNPAFIGLAYALHATNSGSYSFKYQYAIKAFAWSSTQMGNWLSLLGFTRALHLVVILPLILKGIHRYRGRTASVQGSSNTDADSKAKSVDLLVARASLAVDVSSYTASALVTTSDAFVGTTALLSFGGGYPPAIQSLALALTQNSTSESRSNVNPSTDDPRYEGASIDSSASDDTGRLLGAMSVVYALCSQIIGPSLFGMTFVATIASLPRAIFWLSAALNFAALSSLLLVRLAPANQNKEDDAEYVLLNNMEE